MEKTISSQKKTRRVKAADSYNLGFKAGALSSRFKFLTVSVLVLFYSGLEAAYIWAVNLLFTKLESISGTGSGSWAPIILPLLLMFGVWVIQNFLNYFSSILRLRIEISYTKAQISVLFDQLSQVDQRVIDTSNTGEIVGKTIEDSKLALDEFLKPIIEIFRAIFIFISTAAILSFINWKPTLIIIGFSLLIGFITVYASKKLTEYTEKAREQSSPLWSTFYESFKNIKFIKINNMQKEYSKSIKQKVANYQEKSMKAGKFAVLISFIDSSLFAISYVLTIGVCIFFLIDKELSLGSMIPFIISAWSLRYPIITILEKVQELRKASVSFSRLNQIMALEKVVVNPNIKPLANFDITFKDVNFSYTGKEMILENASFKFEYGKKYAIIGTTGLGKSTILDIIAGSYSISKGEVKVGELEVNKENISTIRNSIMLSYQLPYLINGTILENIKLLNQNLSDDDLQKIIKICQVDMILEKKLLGLDALIGENGIQLSVGERKRIQLAQSLAKKAEIYMFDELTASLDEKTAIGISKDIALYLQGKTQIFIEHRLEMIKDVDRIYILKDRNLN